MCEELGQICYVTATTELAACWSRVSWLPWYVLDEEHAHSQHDHIASNFMFLLFSISVSLTICLFSTFENEIQAFVLPSLTNHSRSPAGSPHDSPSASPGMLLAILYCVNYLSGNYSFHFYSFFWSVCFMSCLQMNVTVLISESWLILFVSSNVKLMTSLCKAEWHKLLALVACTRI